MSNLNHQIAKLLAGIASRTDNPNFIFGPIMSGVQARYVENQLTADELAASEATINRIEIQEEINRYIRWAKKGHDFLGSSDSSSETPDWLKRDQKTTTDFAEFFAELPNADTGLIAELDQHSGETVESITAKYTDWQEEQAKETLREEAIAKVHELVDIRAWLIGTLRYLGVSGDEIDEIQMG